MALTGKFSGTTSNSRIKPTITWSAVQSVEGNYSDITAILTYKRNNDQVTGGSWSGTLTIGNQVFKGSKRFNITNDADAEAIRATARILHDDYGKATVTIRATGAISGSTLTSTTISGDAVLDTIPRASQVSSGDGTIGGCATVVITRKNDSFTHSLAYTFGQRSGYVSAEGALVETEETFTGGVVNMQLPEAFYDQLLTSAQGTCTLVCSTYSGQTLIGTKTAQFTVRTDPALCAPQLSGTVTEGNPLVAELTGGKSFIRYISQGVCTIHAQGRYGATITQKRIAGIPVTEDTLTLSALEQDTVQFSCTDSRGYTASCEIPLQLIPYVLLTNDATVQRTDPTSGNATLNFSGNCWQGNFGACENALHYEYSVNDVFMYHDSIEIRQNNTYALDEPLMDLDYRQAHWVDVTVSDKLMTVTKTITVNKGVPVFDWGDTDFQFHVPVTLPQLTVGDMPLAEYIRSIIQGG